MKDVFEPIGEKPFVPRKSPTKFVRDDYDTPIVEKYILALCEFFNVSPGYATKRGETPDAVVFDDQFTEEVIARNDPKEINAIYAKDPYFAFRNPLYYAHREYDAFQPFWKPILAKPGSVLDHGGGAGVFLEVCLRQGLTDLSYADVPGPMYDFVKWFFGDKVKYEADPDNIQGHYDYITSNSVLEHLPDPIAAVKMFGRHLNPGGQIIASMARDIHGQHLKIAIDQYDEVMKLIGKINRGESYE